MTVDNLKDLEDLAANQLKDLMAPFNDGKPDKVWACPWLRWLDKDKGAFKQWSNIEGVLIMQDWGNDPTRSINDEVEYLKGGIFEEATIKNLVSSDGWEKAIWGANSTWLVTNAVWGLRKPDDDGTHSDMCGYLGAKIHKRAFPIWSELLRKLITGRNTEKPLNVVFAGDWARFEKDNKNDKKLGIYLNNWRDWANKGKAGITVEQFDVNLNGAALFCNHPSMWNFVKDYMAGPPNGGGSTA